MSEGATREVRIGDRNVVVPRFNGFKATIAGEIVEAVSAEWPNITDAMVTFSREYEQKNVVRISRAESRLRRYQRATPIVGEDGEPKMTDEGFVATTLEPIFADDDFNADGFVEIPSQPTTPEQVIAVFPLIWKLAKEEVVTLLALVTAPNSALADADEDGTVGEYLKKEGRKILHEGDVDQIVDALSVAVEVVAAQFRNKPGIAGKIAAFIEEAIGTMNATDEPDSTPTSNRQNSSTASDARTDGEDAKLSIVSHGASLSDSEN